MLAETYAQLIDRLAGDLLHRPRAQLEAALWNALEPSDLAIIVRQHPGVLSDLLDGAQRPVAEALSGPNASVAVGQCLQRLLQWACAEAIEEDLADLIATRRRDQRDGFLSEVA